MVENSIEIRKLKETDLPLFESLWTNKDVRRFLGGPITKEKCAEILRNMINDNAALHHSIYSKQFKELVGIVSVHQDHDGIHKEISFQILPEYWRNGFAYSSAIKAIEIAKDIFGLEEIYAETQTQNAISRKLLEKIGMKEIQRLIRYEMEQSVYCMKLNE